MRLLFYFLLGLSCSVYSQAIENKDVIYLKNKKVYHGIILKNEMGIIEFLTTENGEEKILIFQLFEIKKVEASDKEKQTVSEKKDLPQIPQGEFTDPKDMNIKKSENNELLIEQPIHERMQPIPDLQYTPQVNLTKKMGQGEIDYGNPFNPLPRRRIPKLWIREIYGFRGFVEAGYMHGVGKTKYNYFEVSKSVGFQFNPYFYLGMGASTHLSTTHDGGYPLFINPRFNLTDKNTWNPFISLKGGYSVGDMNGLNTSITSGTSFVLKNKKLAFNVGLSYSFFKTKYREFDLNTHQSIRHKDNIHNIGVKLEFEY